MKQLPIFLIFLLLPCLFFVNARAQENTLYPDFSWDHVPLYMHMRKAIAFTQEELSYLAEFPIITLEKTTGSATYGSTEKGSLEAAKAIKEYNPHAKVLYYRNIMVHYQGYDVNSSLEKVADPLLSDASGETNIVHSGKRGAYDLTKPRLQEWWLDHCETMAGYDQIDGIFIDGNIKALEPVFLGKEIGEEKKSAVAEAYGQMMKELDDRVGENKLLIANLIRARLPNSGLDYMSNFDGSYLEGFEIPANGFTRLEYVARGIDATQEAARDGKVICMSMGLGRARKTGSGIDDTRMDAGENSQIQDRLTYSLAIFLICAEKYSYFLAHDGYSVNSDDSSVWLKTFPEYSKPLGPPQGPAIRDGAVYTRKYEHTSVWLDIEHEKAKITWD
ncbi:MAG: hypothetical protein GY790_14490 [Bacteroidetes bacterium]|nr:hypothetical protein [Bacteroidota bacterium]